MYSSAAAGFRVNFTIQDAMASLLEILSNQKITILNFKLSEMKQINHKAQPNIKSHHLLYGILLFMILVGFCMRAILE